MPALLAKHFGQMSLIDAMIHAAVLPVLSTSMNATFPVRLRRFLAKAMARFCTIRPQAVLIQLLLTERPR